MFNKLIWPIRVLFFLFFFLSAFSKIYPNPDVAIHLFVKEQLMSLHIPLCLSTWLSRLLIALEFTIAIGFLVPYYFKRITLTLSTLVLLLFSVFLAIEVFVLGKWTGNCPRSIRHRRRPHAPIRRLQWCWWPYARFRPEPFLWHKT